MSELQVHALHQHSADGEERVRHHARGGRVVLGQALPQEEAHHGNPRQVRPDKPRCAGAAWPNPARYAHTCAKLLDGSVLVTCGINELIDGSIEILQGAYIYTPTPRRAGVMSGIVSRPFRL